MQPNPIDTFLQESEELLAEIEATALNLNGGADSSGDAVNRIFRAFHTLKGSGAMFGFEDVAGFTHHVESLLDQVRDGAVPVSGELSALILSAADHIKALLVSAQGGAAFDPREQAELLARVNQLSKGGGAQAAAAGGKARSKWNISFRPSPSLLSCGGNPVLLWRDLCKLGECSLQGHVDLLPPLSELEPDLCLLRWTAELAGEAGEEEIRDVFLFVEDGSELKIEPAQPVSEVRSAAAQVIEEKRETGTAKSKEATVRVPASRLDRLVNLVGELVMNHSRLSTAAARFQSAELDSPVEEIERLVNELRDDVLQIRMMPIGSIFGRFRRLVFDLSRQLGKEIELVTEGEETELDKSILDQLGEPLVHLLRNSIDHGIEMPEERAGKGKPRQGTIRLSASHRGSDVVVRVEDDGAGMNRAAIRAKAISRGLIPAEANLSDKEILNLILLPGFSTAKTVSSISGRGVGMDVVKRQIDALRGTLNLSSEECRGASVTLTLPLTLAIIDGLLVEAGDSQYILPMTAVTENVELARQERERGNGRNLVTVRGQLVPYIDLRDIFSMSGETPAISKIVLVRYEDQRVGIVVDRVLGTHQTVIQPLGRFYKAIDVVSGSTVMGDGRVALILDVAGVVRRAEMVCQRQTAA